MKHFVTALAAFAALSMAKPIEKRQDIDFDAYNAVPVLPDVAAPVGDAEPAVPTYVASVAASAAASAATSDSGSALVGSGSDAVVEKRHLAKRTECTAQTQGSGPAIRSPADDDTSFQNSDVLAAAANSAPIPVGYNRVATNVQGAASDPSYITYKLLSSYDVAGCTAFCQSIQGCNSFNVYYERDATVVPGPDCPNPASTTLIKCSVFGAPLTANSATNVGQYQQDFHVVIAGSDIYTATTPLVPSGFQGGYAFGTKTVNSPYGYMGVQTFPQTQPYDPSVCATACNQKSAFDIKQGLPSKSNPDICNFFVAYILYKNGNNGVFTCTYYTSAWNGKYANNNGQYDGQGNHYTIGYSNGFAVNGAPVNGVAQ